MEYAKLTGTGLTVSNLCLGTMMFGAQTSEKDSIEIIRYALDAGINFIDTADQYNAGKSEIATGKGLKGDRDKVILATKVFNPTGGINDKGLNRRHIIEGVERSLKNLDTDYIDLYYMHAPDYNTPIEESVEAMSNLVRSGKVRYVAVSNYASWQVCDLLWVADKRNYIAPVVTQNVLNLLTRGVEAELVPFIKAHNIGMVVYNPIAAGLLTGKHSRDKVTENTRFSLNTAYYDRYWTHENFDAVEKLTEIAKSGGFSLLELAMKWCVQRDYVDSVITGVSRLEQLEQNIASVQGAKLSDEILAKCDEVWVSLSGRRFKYNR